MSEDDERKMRRISYLKATANDMAFQIDSDLDNSPVSQAPETPDEQDPNANSQSKRFVAFTLLNLYKKYIFMVKGFFNFYYLY